jgi:hypothetical protein
MLNNNQQQLYQQLAQLQSAAYQRCSQQYYYDDARGAQQPYNAFGQPRGLPHGSPQPVNYSADPLDSLAADAWQSFFGN